MFWFCRSWLFEKWEQKKVIDRFYSRQRFRAIDQFLLEQYREKSPYAISKAFLQKRGALDLYLYGETPLTTLYEMADNFQLTENDILIELGAGRCRGAFFLAEVFGCSIIAIEQVPHFAKIARSIFCPRVRIVEGNFFEVDVSQGTAIYLYGSALSDEEVERIADRFQKIPSSLKVFTVSYPLPGFHIVKQITGRFPWGKTEIYWNEKPE